MSRPARGRGEAIKAPAREAGALAAPSFRFLPVREPPDWSELIARLERLERGRSRD
jgi:hypothetical protein